MRKSLFILLLFAVSMIASSQDRCNVNSPYVKSTVTVTDVGDFTITDSDGNTWNLYEQLALGKTVFIDLFFTT